MAYSMPQDIRDGFPKIHTAGLTDDELRTLIADADAMIDAVTGPRYAVPFATDPTTTPPIIRFLSKTLAMVDVFDRSPNTPEWVTRRIDRAQTTLNLIADGTLAVVAAGGGQIAEQSNFDVIRSTTSGYIPVFGAKPSLGENVDPTRADDEATARDTAWS